MDHLQGAPLLADYLIESGIADKKNAVVVSPDHGGMTRARNLNNMLELEAPVAVIDKRRPKPNVAEVGSIVGDVKGKTAIILLHQGCYYLLSTAAHMKSGQIVNTVCFFLTAHGLHDLRYEFVCCRLDICIILVSMN